MRCCPGTAGAGAPPDRSDEHPTQFTRGRDPRRAAIHHPSLADRAAPPGAGRRRHRGLDHGRRLHAGLCRTRRGRRHAARRRPHRGAGRGPRGVRDDDGARPRDGGAEAHGVLRNRPIELACDVPGRAGFLRAGPAVLVRLARQQLRRLHGAQDHPRDVGARPPARHDPARAAAVPRGADRIDDPPRSALAGDGRGRGRGHARSMSG